MSRTNKASKLSAGIKSAINITSDTPIDPQDIELTNPEMKAFSEGGMPGETGEEQGKAVQKLIERLWLEHHGLAGASDTEKLKAIMDLHRLQLDGDSDDPRLFVPQKILRRLAQGKHERAVQVAEDSINQRQAIGRNAISKQSSQNRNKDNWNPCDADKAIINIFKREPLITTNGLKQRLREQEGSGLIKDYNLEEGEITGMDGIVVAGTYSALESKLRRLRLKNNSEK